MGNDLSAAVRRNLIAMQKLTDDIARVQQRLATGRKVNSPSDNPAAFFTASALNARAAALNTVIDGIGNSKKTLEAANVGIEGMQALVASARSVAYQALSSSSTSRQSLAQQFDLLRSQIDSLARDASYNGQNLLAGSTMTVTFNEDGSAAMTVAGSTVTASSLGIDAAVGNFQSDADINAALADLDAAEASLESMASTCGTSLALVSTREDFAKSMSNLLTSGAEGLVLADTNYEGALLLALQARQDLAATSLSIASKADQTTLKLFGVR